MTFSILFNKIIHFRQHICTHLRKKRSTNAFKYMSTALNNESTTFGSENEFFCLMNTKYEA